MSERDERGLVALAFSPMFGDDMYRVFRARLKLTVLAVAVWGGLALVAALVLALLP